MDCDIIKTEVYGPHYSFLAGLERVAHGVSSLIFIQCSLAGAYCKGQG